METERPDAIFRDPFARRLAGLKGEEIVNTMKQGRAMAWAMIVRTKVFDDLIMSSVRTRGVDTVLNIAAGLDTRPWRLDLPRTLKWIDADLPEILKYKTDSMKDETPKCEYEAVAADMTRDSARRDLFMRVGATGRSVLVVTEGLLIYLTREQVESLATDLAHQPTFYWWLIDIANPLLLKFMTRSWGKAVEKGNAPFKFAPEEGVEFYRPLGWREVESRSAMDEAIRLKREMRFMPLWRMIMRLYPKKKREEMRRMSGFVLLERNEVTAMWATPAGPAKALT
jgi:methyltransferase (TIGR00027 family)